MIAVLDVRIASRCFSRIKVSHQSLPAGPCWTTRRWASSRSRSDPGSVMRSQLRNVSFWGHIDAGKTTLTEKVLYLANALIPPETGNSSMTPSSASRMMPGDVDSGSTVTDFLEAERQRGITIQSAAVGPFVWSSSAGQDSSAQIMLIDTPGHIDFTIEVERSLRVADGCVVLVDGVEGVESQTEGVWRIAQRYNVRSHVVFVNKMDRTGSSLKRSIQSIVRAKLHAKPTLLQLPVFRRQSGDNSAMDEQTLVGLVDLTASPVIVDFYGGKAGEDVETVSLREAVEAGRVDSTLEREALNARTVLIESLSNLDEELLDQSLAIMDQAGQEGSGTAYTDAISTDDVRRAIRRLTIKGEILPVLCGSAAKGIGVQPVLDAIVDFLPSPDQAGDREAAAVREQEAGCVWGQVRRGVTAKTQKQQKTKPQSKSEEAEADQQSVSVSTSDEALSLLAFKVIWDKRKGPMTFVRIYSGTLDRSSTLLNTNTGARERLNKILFVYADRHVETERLQAGQIGVLLGLRDTKTGDTLVDARAATTASKAGKRTRRAVDDDASAAGWTTACNTLTLRRVNVPPPVFSMSIEPLSKSDEGPLREALDMLIRTDPSLHLDGGCGESGGVALGSIAASTGGQMVLSGMGELHLEIARDRLTNEFNARAHLGDVRVSYRETIEDRAEETSVVEMLDRDMMGQRLKAECRITIRPLTEDETMEAHHGGNMIVVDEIQSEDGSDKDVGAARDDAGDDVDALRRAMQAGLLAALSRGPMSGNPLTGLHVRIDSIKSFGPAMSPAKAFSLLGAQALRAAVKQHGAVMMEPFMNVRISCDETSLGKVVGNLTSAQNGIVERVDHAEDANTSSDDVASDGAVAADVYLPSNSLTDGLSHVDSRDSLSQSQKSRSKCTIIATVPLVHLVRYSSTLRALTRGMATYEMSFSGFAVVTPDRQKSILTSLGRL